MKNNSRVKSVLHAFLCFAPILAVAGCSHSRVSSKDAAVPNVHVFSSPEGGIFANAYLVETSDHVVAIDATLLNSTSLALKAQLDAIGKPLAFVLLTHGHPDHYNGLTHLIEGSKAPILATLGATQVIQASDAAKEKQWAPVFGAEWPQPRTFPTRTVVDGESITVDRVKFTVHDLGPGESNSDSYWTMDAGSHRSAFIGDVVLNGVHAYLTDGHSSAWLKNISRLEGELQGAERLYPGHGAAGGLEILGWERTYLEAYRANVRKLARGKNHLTASQKKKLVAAMEKVLPNKKLEFLISLGADPVAAELAAEKSSRH